MLMLALPWTMTETVRRTLTKWAEVSGQVVPAGNDAALGPSPIAREQSNATSLERGKGGFTQFCAHDIAARSPRAQPLPDASPVGPHHPVEEHVSH